MTAYQLITGEGPRARMILDRIAKAAGISSGQALLAHLEGAPPEAFEVIGEAVATTLPSSEPVDELAAKVA